MRRRLAFISRASELLNRSLDYQDTLSALAQLAVPELADYCLIDVAEADGTIRREEVAHPDPGKARLLVEMGRRWPAHLTPETGIARVIATGEAVLAPEIDDQMLRAYTKDPERLAALQSLEMRSSIIVPMAVRGRVLGAVTLNRTQRGRPYGQDDLLVAQELAARAAVAIDNAALFRSEQAARAAAQRAADRTARLQEFTAALSEASTVQAVADVALEHGTTALEAVAGGVCLLLEDGEQQALVSVSAPGVEGRTLAGWQTFPLAADYPVNDAVRACRLLTIESMEEFQERYPSVASELARAGYQAYLAAPLELGGRAIGCINYNFGERRVFSEEDRAFAQALARQATVALERARLFEAEREARERAEDANRAKSQFLATMSHELRTPLNAVLGYADLLSAEVHGPLSARQARYVDRIRAGATHLVSVIDEILTFSRLEARREEVRTAPVDLKALAGEALRLLEPEAGTRGLTLVRDFPEGELVMETDAGKLRQILINLLGNAVKFTERGAVELALEVREGEVDLLVRDTGPGIPEEQQERIFEPFVQLDGSRTRRQGGTGLGLAVSRRFARLLGGELTVESGAGTGSTFRLRLPRPGRAP